ncbi:unnamed protein product [Mytilus edulis]|uniref:Uncharacterized protein n=1 Tax=Mytilus edulis TaxID=6550 RepID=A0A8S3UDQ7_MYTED|nr:unnamed protein product [Mytilus edulis]
MAAKTTRSQINTDVESLVKFYNVTETYKNSQKSSNGKIIPFEYIDKSFYKQKGNCASFITSNTRIHAWISAFGDLIYNKEGNGFDVTWIDKKAENEKIIQTEFVVSNSLDSDDDFLYKIIIYLTTGKILIQGKGWETFCDNKFQACKQLVDNLISKLDKKGNDNCVSVTSNDTNTDMTEETNPKILLTSSMTNSEKDNENHKTENKDKTLNKSEKHAPVTNATNKDENYINLPEQVDSNAVLMINNRLDIFEESLVKITSTLVNTIDILGINHTDTLQELRKIKKSKGSSETLQPEIKLFENQIKEKDDMISSLRKEVQQLNELQDRNQKKDVKELENTKTEHQNLISVIREEKIQSNIETEKLSLKLEQIQNDKDNLKMTFKERTDDKDKTIHNLQERIQSFLYDRDGEPWKKQTKRVSQDNNSTYNNDQQEENLASNPDLTAEP